MDKFRIFGIDINWFSDSKPADTRIWDKRRGRYLEVGEEPLEEGEEDQTPDSYYDDPEP